MKDGCKKYENEYNDDEIMVMCYVDFENRNLYLIPINFMHQDINDQGDKVDWLTRKQQKYDVPTPPPHSQGIWHFCWVHDETTIKHDTQIQNILSNIYHAKHTTIWTGFGVTLTKHNSLGQKIKKKR